MTGRAPVQASASDQSRKSKEERAKSTLIEFPGVSRAVPEWRKQLSQRVREVQELRAREAAEAAATAQESEKLSCALPSAQLELVPDREQQVMNPIVSKALERLERARRSDFAVGSTGAAAATALAPVAEDTPKTEETEPTISQDAQTAARKRKLVVVPPQPAADEPKRKPVRVISDSLADPALSYLETCLSVPALASDVRGDRAGVGRRMIAGLLDLLVVVLVSALFAAGIEFAKGQWSDPRVIGLIGGVALALMFSYLTVSIALTGRTFGMRLLSLRTIDVRTGLIPTGGQAMKRAVGYIFSLSILGLGVIYALIDRDGRTMHDRFSKTVVIQS